MKDLIIRTGTAAAALLSVIVFLTSFMQMNVFAGTNVPVTVEISVTYIVKGNEKTAGGDRFTLAPDDPASPMPEGTAEGRKTISITREGSHSFGEIRYDRPGVHWYTITRETTDKKGVTKDSSTYRAKVIALNDGHGYVLVYRSGSDKKTELVYTDRVAPETGDTGTLLVWACMVLASAAAFAALAAVRNKNRKEAGRHEIR
jgi:pilin isopeptide linkage protein